jgi:hypothetical protein
MRGRRRRRRSGLTGEQVQRYIMCSPLALRCSEGRGAASNTMATATTIIIILMSAINLITE